MFEAERETGRGGRGKRWYHTEHQPSTHPKTRQCTRHSDCCRQFSTIRESWKGNLCLTVSVPSFFPSLFFPCCFLGGYFFASLLLILGWFLCLSARLHDERRSLPRLTCFYLDADQMPAFFKHWESRPTEHLTLINWGLFSYLLGVFSFPVITLNGRMKETQSWRNKNWCK